MIERGRPRYLWAFPWLLLIAGSAGYRMMASPAAGGSWAPMLAGSLGLAITLVPWYRNRGDYGQTVLGAFAVLTLAVLSVGVIVYASPPTGLIAALPMFAAFGAYRAGFEGTVRFGEGALKSAGHALTALIVANAIVAAGQFAAQLGTPSLDVLLAWDIAERSAAGFDPITTRSMGLLLNPNSLGYLGAACLLSVLMLNPPARQWWLGVVASLSCLILSGSRTAIIASVGGVLVAQVLASTLLPRDKSRNRLWSWLGAAGIAAGLMFTAGDRLIQTVDTRAFHGMDPNLAARVEAWRGAWRVMGDRPFGLLRPPQAAISELIDSEYVYLSLLGSVALTALFILVLTGIAITALQGRTRMGVWVAGSSCTIAITAFSQIVTPEMGTLVLLFMAGAARGLDRVRAAHSGVENQMTGARPAERPSKVSRSSSETRFHDTGLFYG